MKRLTKLLMVSVVVLFCTQAVTAQSRKEREAAKAEKIKTLIESQNYVFQADYVIPQTGNSKSLTFGYDLTVSKDTVTAYLPYYGRVTLAPVDASDGGVKFTSTSFSYKSTVDKKGSYNIVITPNEHNDRGSKDVRYVRLNIGKTGYASLQVISNNRDAISYNGTIVERKPEK